MSFYYVKALHIIFIVTWFAGLFYIVRLFIYQTEAHEKPEPERSILIKQFKIMQKRLWYGITWPSAVLSLIFGPWLLFMNISFYLTQPWMLLKLFFVGLLLVYQFKCHIIFNEQKRDVYKWSSFKLRLWNEAATVILVAVVFLVVLKSSHSFLWGMLGLIAFSAALVFAIQVYKKQRLKKEKAAEEATNTDQKT